MRSPRARFPAGSAAAVAWGVAAAGLLAVVVTGVLDVAGGRHPVLPAQGRDWLLSVAGLTLGARVASYAPGNPVGWALLACGACSSITIAASTASAGPGLWLRSWIWWPGYGLVVLALLGFPDGWPVRGRRPAAVVCTALGTVTGVVGLAAIGLRVPGGVLGRPVTGTGAEGGLANGWDTWLSVAAFALVAVGLVAGLLSLVLRLRAAAPGQRGPLVAGTVGAVGLLAAWAMEAVGVPLAWLGAALALPLAAVVAILRYGLYDIDLVVHRSLLYGLLVLALLTVYAAGVLAATQVVPSFEASVAAAVVALTVAPLRQRIQAAIDRWLYGHRALPYELLAALGRTIEMARTPDAVLASFVTGVGEGLNLPFVAVCLGPRAEPETEFGRRRPWKITALPLVHGSDPVGRILVQQRAPDEPWSARDRALLADLATQLGPAAAAVRLTQDLRAARERMVRVREEEKRLLRRDLHDGIGPVLSGARMQVRAAIANDGPTRERILNALDADLALASAEVRRIVDGLRPPALDRGLGAALTELGRRYDTCPASVRLEVTDDLGALPASVEVAVYRVAEEAVANAVRHGAPETVTVTVARVGGVLELCVRDDGTGPGVPRPYGLGLTSMRERCEELGGSFALASPGGAGTEVVARLPLG